MKTWTAEYTVSHESYGGYTHQDGTVQIAVEARTRVSALRKLAAEVNKRCRGTRQEMRMISYDWNANEH